MLPNYLEDIQLHEQDGDDFMQDIEALWGVYNPLTEDKKYCRRGQKNVDSIMAPQAQMVWEQAIANSPLRIKLAKAQAKAHRDTVEAKALADSKPSAMEVDAGEIELVEVIPGAKSSETPSDTVAGALEEISASIAEPLPQEFQEHHEVNHLQTHKQMQKP